MPITPPGGASRLPGDVFHNPEPCAFYKWIAIIGGSGNEERRSKRLNFDHCLRIESIASQIFFVGMNADQFHGLAFFQTDFVAQFNLILSCVPTQIFDRDQPDGFVTP